MRRLPRCVVPAAVVVAVAVMVMAASACRDPGGDPRPPGPTAPGSATNRHALIRALETTRAVESGRLQVVTALTDLDDEPGPPPGRLTVARYRVAFDRRVGRVDVEAGLSAAASALGAPDPAPKGDASKAAARMIAVGDTVYARAGPMAAAVARAPGGWVEIDRGALIDRRPSSDASSLLLDPLGPLDVVGDATGDPRVVGHDVIRGSPVTHVATRTGGGAAAAAVDVWIDADGVIRRLEIRFAGGTGATRDGAGPVVVTTIELFDVGRAVRIAPPGGDR
jgi:hypothetical protein